MAWEQSFNGPPASRPKNPTKNGDNFLAINIKRTQYHAAIL
jgi:hypothetical protein